MSAQNHQPEADLDPGVVRLRQRLRALRGRYPGLAVTTELTHIHDEQVVIRATIAFSDGATITAYAAEPTDAGLLDTAIELAEQRALARTLDLLGVGDTSSLTRRESAQPESPAPRGETPAAEAAPDRPEPPRFPTESTARPDEDRTPPIVEALRRGTVRRQQPVEAEPEPEPESVPAEPDRPEPTRPESSRPEPPREEPARPEPDQQEPARPEPQVSQPAAADPEPDMADYNWTHFWRWARANDLSTKGQVEVRINRPIDGLTPFEVRQLLHESGIPL